jgi:hypothetical protein
MLALSDLSALTSLRLSLGISIDSNPVPWAIFLLGTLAPNHLRHLTIDLRVDENRAAVRALPWAELDAALSEPQLADLHALVLTCFPYENDVRHAPSIQGAHETVQWLNDEIPGLLPRANARDAFESHELSGFSSL